MVHLTMTHAIVEAIQKCKASSNNKWNSEQHDDSTSLEAPTLGKPISHFQVIAISKCLRQHKEEQCTRNLQGSTDSLNFHLDTLLRGARIYMEPPQPKIEPTSEYKALMARLRKEEEARVYERMINPLPPTETYSQRFPSYSHPKLSAGGSHPDTAENDEITYADMNRQMALIINIIVSIVACSVAIWMAASHWTTPKRLGLSMGGSGMIGIAEVVVYTGYLRRLQEAREKGKKTVEVKEIIKTWIIEGNDQVFESKMVEPASAQAQPKGIIRRRNTTANR